MAVPAPTRALVPRLPHIAARSQPLLLITLLALAACWGHPSSRVATGEVVSHFEAGFSLTAPSDWEVSSTSRGLSLVRKTPYEGGFPTLKIRRITSDEAEILAVTGNRSSAPVGEITYRYQRWSNSRGTGYRLEALVRSPGGLLFVDASIWDSSSKINRDFFDTEFWPIINSLRERR